MTDETHAAPASDNPASRMRSAERLAEVATAVTPPIDALATAVQALGGTLCVAIEVDGDLYKRRSLRSRFDVTLRDPDSDETQHQELAPAGTLKAFSAAVDALRSYQHGNASPELARNIADHCMPFLAGAR